MLFELIFDCITNLLQLSVAIQHASRQDQFAKVSKLPPLPSSFDVEYVSQKFPKVAPWLAQRLGTALTRRRQHFAYRRDHNAKLSSGVDQMDEMQSLTEVTKATKLIQTNTGYDQTLDMVGGQDDAASATTFRTEAESSGVLRVPPAPAASADEQPFECPFCYNIIVVQGRESWK